MWHILLPCLFLLHSLLVHAYSNNNLINRANAHDRLHRVHPSRLPSVLSYAEQKEYDNDGIHLALSPSCGTVGRTGEVNTGIDWQSIKTVVAFGDSVSPKDRVNFHASYSSSSLRSEMEGTAPRPRQFAFLARIRALVEDIRTEKHG